MSENENLIIYDEMQLAELLQISVRTVQGFRLHGGGPPWIKAGKAVRYLKDDIIKWLNDRKRTT